MEVVKAFNENNLHTEIVIKGTITEPLFRASDIGEILEMGNIRTSIQYFDETERHVHTMDTSTGPKQVTFLTEKGLYKILFKSRKPIAEKFQNWVCQVIKEIRLNSVYNLQKQLEKQKTELQEIESVKNKEMEEKIVKEKENILLKEYCNSGPLVYIIKVKTFPNGEYVVKIGHSTIGIQNRYYEHKKNYEQCILMNCVSLDKSKDFERFLHQHNSIRVNKVNYLTGHEHENELFLIGKELTYEMILTIINDNKNNFNYNIGELMKENELLKYKVESNQNNLNNELLTELNNTIKVLSNKLDYLENTNKEILNKLNSTETRTTTNFQEPLPTIGPRLQKINPDTLQIIKVYETVTECMKEDSAIKRPSIHKAIEENLVYKGFRWMYVDRELDPNVLYNIQPNKKSKSQNLGYIAKLNATKTQIINVYIDRKTAAVQNGYESTSALDNPVKKGTLAKGHYYMLYDTCEENLKREFVNRVGEPILYKDGVGQYDTQNNLIREFVCKYDCIKTLQMSDKTLAKALDKNKAYNGHYYKSLGTKTHC